MLRVCGTRSTYIRGCRCAECKAVNVAYLKKRREDRAIKDADKVVQKVYRDDRKRDLAGRRFYRLYGITFEERDRMLEQQGGRCAICQTATFGSNGPHLDHDHATKRVRAVLCSSCNVGLGHFREDPALLMAAIAYLQHHKDSK